MIDVITFGALMISAAQVSEPQPQALPLRDGTTAFHGSVVDTLSEKHNRPPAR